MPTYVAHSENPDGQRHDLIAHLKDVAARARLHGDKFGAGDVAYWAGLWHDLGKFHPDFQKYIAAPTPNRGPDHSSAGMLFASGLLEPVSFLVAGHHAGLPSKQRLKERIREKSKAKRGEPDPIKDALALARTVLPDIEPTEVLAQHLPTFLNQKSNLKMDLFLRMAFSALVDADFLDTEKHFQPDREEQRSAAPPLEVLWQKLEAFQTENSKPAGSPLNQIRHAIDQHCRQAAELPPGAFRLTVPTGGGKTRSGMTFALRHALLHGKDRVIFAIPYTSIIEQTSSVYRDIFEEGVLEHHSAVPPVEAGTDPVSLRQVWSRLAAENWDAPIVVTTTVQLFESLFAHRTSACRKLHDIARSVIVLDEVQTLPPTLLGPILDVLQQLIDHYGVTVVLCTATQPALTQERYLHGLREVREIVPDPARYFRQLRRVRYEFRLDPPLTWQQVAEEMRQSPQALAVLNTKKDAFALMDALEALGARPLHLSTQMCGLHRSEVLQEIRQRLKDGKPCLLVSTQVVEAGVDLDFPLVLRALGPLDRIVQAAGRCNREGKLEFGRVLVFVPVEGGTPPGVYRTAIDKTRKVLAGQPDLDDPNLHETYFARLWQAVETDQKNIKQAREDLDFPEVAKRFKLIDQMTVPAIVHPPGHESKVDRLLRILHRQEQTPRWLLRQLQPFLVSLYEKPAQDYAARGLLQEIAPGLYEWLGSYDATRGLVDAGLKPDDLVL